MNWQDLTENWPAWRYRITNVDTGAILGGFDSRTKANEEMRRIVSEHAPEPISVQIEWYMPGECQYHFYSGLALHGVYNDGKEVSR